MVTGMGLKQQIQRVFQQSGDEATPLSMYSIATLFIGAGVLHFVVPSTYERIMPRVLPYPRELVYLSGVFEIIGGFAVLPLRTRRLAGYGLIALLIAVFPANVQMLLNARSANASLYALVLLWLRLPLQLLLIAWVRKTTRVSNVSTRNAE